MASEKDRWWCEECDNWITDVDDHDKNDLRTILSGHPQAIRIPAAALDAHTAEVIAMITTYIAENCATSADTWAVDPSQFLEDIRALVLREEK